MDFDAGTVLCINKDYAAPHERLVMQEPISRRASLPYLVKMPYLHRRVAVEFDQVLTPKQKTSPLTDYDLETGDQR